MQVDQAVRQAEAIFRFTEEVDRRLAEHGIAGMDDLFRIHEQVRDALGRVDGRELDWASLEAGRLSTALDEIGRQLAHLSQLKESLEAPH